MVFPGSYISIPVYGNRFTEFHGFKAPVQSEAPRKSAQLFLVTTFLR
jgi:hypothetical protein